MNPPQRGSAKSRAEALGKSLCLRCGVAGHQAKNCPASGDRKRKADNAGEDDVRMVVEYDESFPTQDLDYLTDRAVQDGGAAWVLGSRKMVGNYIKLLEVLGVNIHKEVEVFECQKGFKYGNSQKEITNMCCLIPTYVGGQRRKILCYIIGGNAPILIGRPLMREFGIVVDWQQHGSLSRWWMAWSWTWTKGWIHCQACSRPWRSEEQWGRAGPHSSCLMTSPTTSTQLTDFLCRPSWTMRTSSAELRPLWWQPQVRLRQAMPSTSSRRMSRARFIRVLDVENHNQGQDWVQSPRWAQEALMMMEFHRKDARRIQAQERR